jgi:hypothetical protein
VEPCGGLGGSRARDRRVEWRVEGPRAREWMSDSGSGEAHARGPCALGCFGLGVLDVIGWPVWVQQHCGAGSCTVVALFGAVVSAPLLLFRGGSLQ